MNEHERAQLPGPETYYADLIADAKAKVGKTWTTVRCVFHEDRTPSLRLHMDSGGFYCHGCGAKGGDIVRFHMERTGLDFRKALQDLGVTPSRQSRPFRPTWDPRDLLLLSAGEVFTARLMVEAITQHWPVASWVRDEFKRIERRLREIEKMAR